jgi:hypothetical protein
VRRKSAAAGKRGTYPDPDKRAFINELVCEGCAATAACKSNCVSIQPVETEFGRKRKIDQSGCNKDFSCIEGFCPSFVTVHGGRIRKADYHSAQIGTRSAGRSAGSGEIASLETRDGPRSSMASAEQVWSRSAPFLAWRRTLKARDAG